MSVASVGAGWVMLLLAVALSGVAARTVLPAAGYLGLWVLTLSVWASVLKRDWLRIIASSLIAAFTIGGPLLWYLRLDLGPVAGEPAAWKFGPLLGLLLHPASPSAGAWLTLCLMAFSAASLGLARHFLAPSTLLHH